MSDLRDKLAGKFIVIDGPDGAGKGTQIRLLAEFLRAQGVGLQLARDPGGTAIGDRIREILLDARHAGMTVPCELLLYMASRAQLVHEIIRPALGAGRCVLCDRFVSATIAYQGAGGQDMQAMREIAKVAIGQTRPDLTIILDLAPEEGLRRVHKDGSPDRMEAKSLEFHRKVRESFLRQAHEDQGRFTVVSASGSVEEVQNRLRRAIQDHPISATKKTT